MQTMANPSADAHSALAVNHETETSQLPAYQSPSPDIAPYKPLHNSMENNYSLVEIRCTEITQLKSIGGGSFGTVYCAELKGSAVAVKFFNPATEGANRAEREQKALQEAKLMRAYSHPAVVQLIGVCVCTCKKDSCEAYNGIGIVSSFLSNGSLDGKLQKMRKKLEVLHISKRLELAYEVCICMDWLHGHDPMIIHRDLKPENLLFGDNGKIQICDFGLSELLSPGTFYHTLKICGTARYMAPEAWKRSDINEKCDVYSFGVVLWELLTLERAFYGIIGTAEFEKEVCGGTRPNIPDTMDEGLANLIQRCWAEDPSKRPSFSDIREEILHMMPTIAIHSTWAREFWQLKFPKKMEISWYELATELIGLFRIPDSFELDMLDKSCPADMKFYASCMKALRKLLLKNEKHPEPLVHVSTFGHVIGLFHSEITSREELLSTLHECTEKPWFFGMKSRDESIAILEAEKEGAFLIRVASYDLHPNLAVSYVKRGERDTENTISHRHILHKAGEGYSCVCGSQTYAGATLVELVAALSNAKKLTAPTKSRSNLAETSRVLSEPGYDKIRNKKKK